MDLRRLLRRAHFPEARLVAEKILLDEQSGSGHMGRRHGGAEHGVIARVVVDLRHGGIDVAAGGSDVGRQGQIPEDAPGGEIRQGRIPGQVFPDHRTVHGHGSARFQEGAVIAAHNGRGQGVDKGGEAGGEGECHRVHGGEPAISIWR